MLAVLAAPAAGAAQAQPNLPTRAAVFTVPKEAVGDATAHAAAADKALSALTRALTDANVPTADVPALFPPTPTPNTAIKLFKEGLEAFDNLDTDAAAKKFQESMAFLEQNPGAADTKTLTERQIYEAQFWSRYGEYSPKTFSCYLIGGLCAAGAAGWWDCRTRRAKREKNPVDG